MPRQGATTPVCAAGQWFNDMGFLDFFRGGNAAKDKAAQHQRAVARKLAALPMPEFIPECLRRLNQADAGWAAHVRQPHRGARVLAVNKHLPDELADFYCMCDGFESPDERFPARLLPISSLRLGGAHKPSAVELVNSYWAHHGNPSGKPGHLRVLSARTHADAPIYELNPSALDLSWLMCRPQPSGFVVLLTADATSELHRGAVLEVHNGSATRHSGFKAWLGSCASRAGP